MTTTEFDLFLGSDGCGRVRLPSNFTPAHLRAVREAIGSEHEIAPISDDTWSPVGGSEFLTVRKRAMVRAVNRATLVAAAVIGSGFTLIALKTAAAGHWTQAILAVLDEVQEYV